jgi:hypothetical protein
MWDGTRWRKDEIGTLRQWLISAAYVGIPTACVAGIVYAVIAWWREFARDDAPPENSHAIPADRP